VRAETDDLASGTTNAGARDAFVAGYRAWRDGDLQGAGTELKRAIALDPSYAAAHLWLALLNTADDLLASRKDFQKASTGLDTLSAPNQTLLAAFAPLIQQEPPDRAACIAKLEGAARSANTSYLWAWVGLARFDAEGPSPRALADMDRALAIDPSFTILLHTKGQGLAYLGRFDEALSVLDRCLALSPLSSACYDDRRIVHTPRGDCAAIEADARRQQAAAPDATEPYLMLAGVALWRDDPVETVIGLETQCVDRLDEHDRPLYRLWVRFTELLLRGQLDDASRRRDVEAREELRRCPIARAT